MYPISIEEITMKQVALNMGLTRRNGFNENDNNYYKINDDLNIEVFYADDSWRIP